MKSIRQWSVNDENTVLSTTQPRNLSYDDRPNLAAVCTAPAMREYGALTCPRDRPAGAGRHRRQWCASPRCSGVQGVSSKQYPLTRTVSTGSWWAPEEQGRGFGTRMRSMVIDSFARHFGTHRFDTGYIDGNDASQRVSEKLGYS